MFGKFGTDQKLIIVQLGKRHKFFELQIFKSLVSRVETLWRGFEFVAAEFAENITEAFLADDLKKFICVIRDGVTYFKSFGTVGNVFAARDKALSGLEVKIIARLHGFSPCRG